MSYVATQTKFHCALDGQGLLLQGAPNRLAYHQSQAPVYGNRFASGDRSYNDLSKWWYFAQTDWSGGFKDEVAWADDAKYYYSTNIDAYSQNGAIKLMNGLILAQTLTQQIVCGAYEIVTSTALYLIGTDNTGSNKPAIFSDAGTPGTTEIASAFMPTAQTAVTEVLAHKLKVWFSTIGAGSTYVVGKCDEDGLNPVDYSAAIGTACDAITLQNAYCLAQDSNTIWVGVRGTAGQNYITKSVDGGTNWTKVLNSGYEKVVCVLPIGSTIYFLTVIGAIVKLKSYDGSALTVLYSFAPRTYPMGNAGGTGSASRKALVYFNNKIIITIGGSGGHDEIWEYLVSTGQIIRIYLGLESKISIDQQAVGQWSPLSNLNFGVVQHDNKLWWGNLIYDGTYFYNGKKDATDAGGSIYLSPLYSRGDILYYLDNNNLKKLYYDNLSAYKGTADKNYIVFNQFDLISKVDKLANSLTILFKPLVSGEKIAVEYLTGELTSSASWTTLGFASYAQDGGTISEKTFLFGNNVTFKKIWFRIKLESGGTTTPTLTDVILDYLPIPTPTKLWTLNVNCADEIKDLSGAIMDITGRELKAKLEAAWWNKSLIDFQDIDYASTLLNGSLTADATTITVDSTNEFPEQGRIKIDDEEILYTGKTPTTFTGCSRGARETVGIAHSDNAVVNNAYKVIITDLEARVPILLEDKNIEYIVGLSLREV